MIRELFERTPRILVVGDVMLDHYVFGRVNRISPEGPFPILDLERMEHHPGGAAAVALKLTALGADVTLASMCGADINGGMLLAELNNMRVKVARLVDQKTTVKERFMGSTGGQYHQMLRLDDEKVNPWDTKSWREVFAYVEDEYDVVLVSDYDKGTVLQDVVSDLASLGAPVIVDPAKHVHWRRYLGCTAITPNRIETELVVEMSIDLKEGSIYEESPLCEVSRRLIDTMNPFDIQHGIVKLDRWGILHCPLDDMPIRYPAIATEVVDAIGAGDAVLAMIGYAHACGADWETAIKLANVLAGLQVQRLGNATVARDELINEWERRHPEVPV